jgi:hypothetical protein
MNPLQPPPTQTHPNSAVSIPQLKTQHSKLKTQNPPLTKVQLFTVFSNVLQHLTAPFTAFCNFIESYTAP